MCWIGTIELASCIKNSIQIRFYYKSDVLNLCAFSCYDGIQIKLLKL